MRDIDAHENLLRTMFAAAVARARPDICVPMHLPEPPRGRTIVVGAGKAAASMAQAVEKHWPTPLEGVVVTRYGHALPCRRIDVLEAGHPIPDEAGVVAAHRLFAAVSNLTVNDLVLCLLSGGGSALLAAKPPGITLAEERALTSALLRSGARIGEMNMVRRKISLIRGGGLAAAAAPARIVTLAISDVPNDDPLAIASGPTVPDSAAPRDALAILRRYGIAPPPGVTRWLDRPAAKSAPRPPAEIDYRIVANARDALEASASAAMDFGLAPHILGDAIEGEAREVAEAHAGAARQAAERGETSLFLSGGETTVTVRGEGRGGRNAEYLLALGLSLANRSDVWALAADTDGIDGSEDNAGAVWTPDTLARARERGLDPETHLAHNDAYRFFAKLDQLVVTGPTRTNVNDFRAMLVAPQRLRLQ
ncbi:MAG: glycerate kinase [Hyphomonadaceae bacterium]|nr:glycerate kinase [Hyphomonadaceae bacterium]GIK49454.1 MAG: hydroxypyruvate reductase [Alphaproteobacteria bacterium]